MDMVLSVVMLAAIALFALAIWLWRKRGADKQVWLLLALVVVLIGNVLIWPRSSDLKSGGTAPVDRAAEGGPAN